MSDVDGIFPAHGRRAARWRSGFVRTAGTGHAGAGANHLAPQDPQRKYHSPGSSATTAPPRPVVEGIGYGRSLSDSCIRETRLLEHMIRRDGLPLEVGQHPRLAFRGDHVDTDAIRLPEPPRPPDGLVVLLERVRREERLMGAMLPIEAEPSDAQAWSPGRESGPPTNASNDLLLPVVRVRPAHLDRIGDDPLQFIPLVVEVAPAYGRAARDRTSPATLSHRSVDRPPPLLTFLVQPGRGQVEEESVPLRPGDRRHAHGFRGAAGRTARRRNRRSRSACGRHVPTSRPTARNPARRDPSAGTSPGSTRDNPRRISS